ncbi:MAG TPA: FAD-dependent oxidoreductase [Candidatus Acidoferrales bacterium]|nr:FAD-dependent oxidoreductase [Candidatus Acidoferrales bacterium]
MDSASRSAETLQTRCCIAGGGPAGMMLGFLLARAGIDVVVLEKHADFLRDFRGDTVHPSTLEVLHELGVLEEFLKRPHQEIREVRARIGGEQVVLGDLSRLRTHCRFMALMPQWDFLDFLAEFALRYPAFRLKMQAEVTGLVEDRARIAGIRGRTPAGPVEVRAELVVGADGRNSVVRERAGLAVESVGAGMDALQLRLSKQPDDPAFFVHTDRGKTLVTIDRGDYWHCGFAVPKGTAEEMRARGIEDFRASIAEVAPFLRDRVGELRDWSDVKLLTIRVDRLRRWHRPGLVCIGDAAHAMSPVGGVGINLAIQDAVAAANALAEPLRRGAVSVDHLAKIQRRRAFPTRITQGMQALMQRQVWRGLGRAEPTPIPLPLRLLERTTLPCRFRTHFIGVGVRPEHVKTPDISQSSQQR